MKKVLTIAGSDSSGGAGIQADLKTSLALGTYGMSVITALTAQNTMGVDNILDISPDMVTAQIDAVFRDIVPDAVKIGMLSSAEIIHTVAEGLHRWNAGRVVLDPVMVSTSGHTLLKENAREALMEELLPAALIVTPNIPEAEILAGRSVQSKEDMETAAAEIGRNYSISVLVKGGHLAGCADDVLYENGVCTWFHKKYIDVKNTHGTGCTLSSAIACGLARGYDLNKSIAEAKVYLQGALEHDPLIGHGNGPVHHGWMI